jgi:hypothetical protein
MLALIKDGAVVQTVAEGRGFDLPGKRRVLPAVAGWASEDGYKVVPVVVEVDDQSTGSNTVTEPSGQTVEADRVVRTSIKRDKTQAEIDAEQQALIDEAVAMLATNRSALKALAEGLFITYNAVRVLEGKAEITKAQYINWLKEQMEG